MPKMVFHGGFGVFYAPVGLAFAGSGYAQTTSYSPVAPTTGAYTSIGSSSFLQNPFSTAFNSTLVAPSGNTLGPLTGVGSALPLTGTLASFQRRYPLVQQYSMDIQQDLPLGINFKLSYVGAHSRNILNSGNINQLPDGVMASYAGGATALNSNIANKYQTASINGYKATGIVAQPTIGLGQSLLPYPQFGAVTVSLDDGYSRYNALAVKVQKRMNGLTVLSTYTWSANWDNLWSAGSQVYSTYGPQDIYNPKAERSRALNNVPNRFTAAVSYDLPFGRGKKFLGNAPWYLNELVGGWQINDEWTLQNGIPLTIQQTNLSTGQGATGVGGSYQRPNLVGDAHAACLSGRPQGRLGTATVYGSGIGQPQYLNAAAFSPAKPYTYGNAPRMLPCQGPGSNNSDVSINKNFKITEKVNAQFRAEALNAFNTPQFGNPTLTYVVSANGVAGTPTVPTGTAQTLGNVTSQINYSRIIQLGGRISF